MKPTLLILAAGMGSRYGGLKQVDGVGPSGEAIIEYSIYDAIRAGFGKVVFVIRESIEAAFKEKFANKFEDKIEVAYVFQEFESPVEGIEKFPPREKPWGTAHAVLVARKVVNEPFVVINADDYYGVTAFQAIADFLTTECTPEKNAMVGYVLKNTLSDNGTVSRGVCEMDENSNLTDVVERLKVQRIDGNVSCQAEDGGRMALDENSLVSMNLWGFHPSIFETIRSMFVDFVANNQDNPKSEFYIPLVVNNQIQSGDIKLKVLASDEIWYGVTYQEDKETVQKAFKKLVAEGKYPANLWA